MKTNEKITEIAAIGVLCFIFLSYVFGMYKMVADDHRYTAKNVTLGVVVFPYTVWVGVKSFYHIVTTQSQERVAEEECLDSLESSGVSRKPRLRYCRCMTKTQQDESRCDGYLNYMMN